MEARARSLLDAFVQDSPRHRAATRRPNDNSSSAKPWDSDDYAKRLGTFKPSTWFHRPRGLMADVCAQHGWINSSSDELRCVTCMATICLLLPSITDREEYERAAEEYEAKLKSVHRDYCVWKGAKAPDSFLFFPELSFDECVHAFRSRFSTIMKLRSHMPIISDDAMNQLSEINEESLKGLMEFLPHEKSDEDIVGCLIALCGWETQSLQSEAAHSNLLVCTTCNQKLVASDLLTIHSNEKDSRRGVPTDKCPFDVIGDHRPWCSWIAVNALNAKRPGWKVVVGILTESLAPTPVPSSQVGVAAPIRRALDDAKRLVQSFVPNKVP
ncbi:zinc finger C3HC-type protein 1-like [Oscarella lobularis]|uniref:zinc finger C3HC-type protein 1-like n=1 Tax=Oscarella lobularis TaxID=121494 RepID=UPI003313D6A8